MGGDLDRSDWRIYRVDRMTPRVPAGPLFTPRPLPAEDASTFIAARFKGSSGEDRWPCSGEVVVELPVSELAPWVGDGQIEELSATSCRLTLGSWSWPGVVALIARFDAPFTILGPEELSAAATTFASRLTGGIPRA